MMFFVILLGTGCVIFGQQAERWVGIIILIMMVLDIVLEITFDNKIITRGLSDWLSDVMRFSAFACVALRSMRIWPILCAGVTLLASALVV
jgi:hypothetical protein